LRPSTRALTTDTDSLSPPSHTGPGTGPAEERRSLAQTCVEWVGRGLNYYTSFKLTDDSIGSLPDILIRGKNKVFAVGPEVQLALARHNTLYGFLKVNYQWEVYARTTTEGRAMTILATFLMKPLKLSNP
jgi:hypothetical protein